MRCIQNLIALASSSHRFLQIFFQLRCRCEFRQCPAFCDVLFVVQSVSISYQTLNGPGQTETLKSSIRCGSVGQSTAQKLLFHLNDNRGTVVGWVGLQLTNRTTKSQFQCKPLGLTIVHLTFLEPFLSWERTGMNFDWLRLRTLELKIPCCD